METSMFSGIVELCCYLWLDMAKELSQDYANYFLKNNVEKEVSLKAVLFCLLGFMKRLLWTRTSLKEIFFLHQIL